MRKGFPEVFHLVFCNIFLNFLFLHLEFLEILKILETLDISDILDI